MPALPYLVGVPIYWSEKDHVSESVEIELRHNMAVLISLLRVIIGTCSMTHVLRFRWPADHEDQTNSATLRCMVGYVRV